MFTKHSDAGYVNPLPGVERRTLVHGAKMLMTEFRFRKGSTLPLHTHPHEQAGYLVSGHLRLTVDGRDLEVMPGVSYCIAGGIEHGAYVVEDSVVVEVFSPVREDYLPGRLP